MNILPLILALVLMLSVLTVEKLEKFKNQTIVQKQYQLFLQVMERQVFNQRQKNLYGDHEKSLRQLSFRYLVDKDAREGNAGAAKQYRMLIQDLMKILYGEAAFFKNLEKRRSNFLEEMLTGIEQAADAAPEKTIKRIQDIARITLEDSELQEAFYHMLKGTIERERLKEVTDASPRFKENAYVSLFKFINYDGKASGKDGKSKQPVIIIQLAPREILKAIFETDEVVEAIIARRNELAANKDNDSETTFRNEFSEKRRADIDDKLLDFRISEGKKDAYN